MVDSLIRPRFVPCHGRKIDLLSFAWKSKGKSDIKRKSPRLTLIPAFVEPNFEIAGIVMKLDLDSSALLAFRVE